MSTVWCVVANDSHKKAYNVSGERHLLSAKGFLQYKFKLFLCLNTFPVPIKAESSQGRFYGSSIIEVGVCTCKLDVRIGTLIV